MTDRIIDSTYMSDYMRCPEYCRLRHHCGYRKPATTPGPLEIGSAVHKALATYYKSGCTPDDAEAAASLTLRQESALWEVRDKLEGTYATQSSKKRGVTFAEVDTVLRSYLRLQARRDMRDLDILAVESYLEAEIADGVRYCGIVDLVMREPKTGEVTLFDHKTTSRGFVSPTTMGQLRDNLQMPGYFLMREARGWRTDKYAFNMLLLGPTPKVKVPWERSAAFRMEQWRLDNARSTILQEVASIPEDDSVAWSRRPQGCFAYFRECEFHGVCYTHADLRPMVLEQNYIVDFWNPKEKAEED